LYGIPFEKVFKYLPIVEFVHDTFLARNDDTQETTEPLVMLGLLYSFYGLHTEAFQKVTYSLDQL
jgi:hypothetical protein